MAPTIKQCYILRASQGLTNPANVPSRAVSWEMHGRRLRARQQSILLGSPAFPALTVDGFMALPCWLPLGASPHPFSLHEICLRIEMSSPPPTDPGRTAASCVRPLLVEVLQGCTL
jgi:hypothetical protein